MSRISTPTKSFIVLCFFAIFGLFLCLSLWSELDNSPYNNFSVVYEDAYSRLLPGLTTSVQVKPTTDTTAWKTYTNKTYNFSFKYKPDWKVLELKKVKGYNVLEVDPGKKYYNIKIFINDKDYYVMGGLPTKNQTIGGQPAINVNNLLYGIKAGNYYYTFDVGLSTSLAPDFDALVYSVKFGGW